MATNGGGGGEI